MIQPRDRNVIIVFLCVYTRECKTNSVKTRKKKTLVKWLFDILSQRLV